MYEASSFNSLLSAPNNLNASTANENETIRSKISTDNLQVLKLDKLDGRRKSAYHNLKLNLLKESFNPKDESRQNKGFRDRLKSLKQVDQILQPKKKDAYLTIQTVINGICQASNSRLGAIKKEISTQ
jgi:hypothetical protein